MSDTQQPEAMRLADKYEIEGFLQDHRFAQEHWCRQAVAELRSQHTRIAELEAQLSAIGAGGVEPLRKPTAQAVHPENIREGAPYDNPEFEQLARDMGVWGTAQSAVCAQFWLAATQPAAQGMEKDAARYRWLRSRDLETISQGGVFAGMTPENVILNGEDLDEAVDTAIAAQAKQGEKK